MRTTPGGRRIAVVLTFAATALPLLDPARVRADELTFQRVVEHAEFPTNLAFAPDGGAFYAERETGRIRLIEASGTLRSAPIATLPVDASANGMGLLGLAVDPDFGDTPWLYAYYSGSDGRNHVVRLRADHSTDADVDELLTLLPTRSGWHNGGDLAFGPDGELYVTVGDGQVAARAQDRSSLGGKILRLGRDGSIPADNPFGADSPVFATGFRNSFGICFGPEGTLWETEIGPGEWDEVNRIRAGADYGWPTQIGPAPAAGSTAPVFAWRRVVVPTGCLTQRDGSLFVGDLRGDLHRIAFPAGSEPTDRVVATFDTGITDVERAPDGRVYVATTDGIWLRGPDGSGRAPFTPVGVLILVGLLGLLLLARRRLERR